MLFVYVATSVVAYSIMALLFKAASAYVRPNQMVWVATLVATALGLVVWLASGETVSWTSIALGAVAGITFYVGSVFRAKAVATSPASLVFTITNLDLVLTGAILMAIPWFQSPPTLGKVLAVVLALGAVFMGAQIRGDERLSRYTYICLGLLILSMLASATYARLLPHALLFFLFIDHLAGVLPTLNLARDLRRSEWLWGFGVGVTMFIGFWTLLLAQSQSTPEQLTQVFLGLSLKTPLTAVLAIPIFKEDLNIKKIAALVLASLAVALPSLL